jgi:hypothetical protein
MSIQKREPGDNVFIIHSRSNHNYENFIVGSYQVRSGWVSGHLVSGHFGSRIILGRVRSGRVSSHLVPGHFGFQIVSGRVGSAIRPFRVSGHIKSGWIKYLVI